MSDDFKDRLADYIPVNERLEQFHATFPEGRVITSILSHDHATGFVMFKAELFRQIDDAQPMSTGHAFEERSEGYVNKTSYIENCETSAVDRALALAGYEIKRGIASKEEMQKVDRMGGNGNGPDPNSLQLPKCPDCGGAVWDNRATKKGRQPDFKCKDKTCGKGIWLEDAAGKLTPDEAAIAGLMAQAEKLLPPTSKKLAQLRGISDPNELGEKVQILVDLAKKKDADLRKRSGDDPEEKERLALIDRILAGNPLGDIERELGGRDINGLNLDALIQLESDLVPF